MRSPEPDDPAHEAARTSVRGPRYGRYVLLLALLIIVAITINTINTRPNGVTGLKPGEKLPPFAVPLVRGTLDGDANVATAPHQGSAGEVPACSVRGPQVLNICELSEHGPVVLALFVNSGSCPAVLGDMQRLSGEYPQVRFAAVAVKEGRAPLRKLVRSRGLTFPIGFDKDGWLVPLYKDASCPQITFAYPGGEVQSDTLLHRPSAAQLRSRVGQLLAASRARGWKGAP
jgi:hypothetical protein